MTRLLVRRNRHLARSLACAGALLGCVLPQTASAAGGFALSKTAPPRGVCAEPSSPGATTCEAILVPTVPASSADATGPELEGSGEKGGFDPKDLHEAYKLPENGGSSSTIAIVDAYNDPYAESDLQKYREKYKVYYKGIETACTEANGCFKKVNQKGETSNYPANEEAWSAEISLDLDMISAACAECKILLVEANEEGISNLGPSDEKAESLGATVISNSWNKGFEGSELGEVSSTEEKEYNKYFDHEKVPILFSAGDFGYSTRYPAVSHYVIAVGGTKLKKESEGSRKWTEEVWSDPLHGYRVKGRGTGSGCSQFEPKPKWQTDKACIHRVQNDVAAVASPESPVSIYDTYKGGWANSGGTSASAPFVAGVEGLSSNRSRSLKAEAFYLANGSLFDVTKGSNGTCTPPSEDAYYCTAEVGFDGPAGNGAPDGSLAVGPSATTEAATTITKSGATLNGAVNPEGVETKYYFEYGTSEAYGTRTAEASAGAGTASVKASEAITGLVAGTTYHFRIVATSGSWTTDGEDRVFTAEDPPENTVAPVASPATPYQAVRESATTGTWTNNPISYAYQWERCNATGGECANISGATNSTYTPVEADVGHTLVVKVTATNEAGAGSAPSAATAKVIAIGQISEYSLPSGSYPRSIAAGPDGDVWFTDHSTGKIGKITTSGTITEYSLPAGSEPAGIAAGPEKENDLWFMVDGTRKIGKISTAGAISEYSLPSGTYPEEITAGPDGNLWFTEGSGKIGKITTSGTITEYSLAGEHYVAGIAVGPDGNLWFTNILASKIGKISTSGAITEYTLPVGSHPYRVAAGPEKENDLWFTDYGTSKIGKISTSGTISEYSLPEYTKPYGITAGPDGYLWFAGTESSKIGRISTSGTVTEYSLPASSWPVAIAMGPDSNLWFTDSASNKIGKITP